MGMEAKKRQLTEDQATALELSFTRDRRLDTARKQRLAAELGLDSRQVAVWFQNRRARWRCKQLEENYASVCASFNTLLVEKRRLEDQVMELQAQLDQAKNEILRLSSGHLGSTAADANTGSPNCSTLTFISGDAINQHNDPPPLAEFQQEVLYMCASSMDDNLWGWHF